MTDKKAALDPERLRLDEDLKRAKNWKRWGPYLSERQWGTVREDYSPHGTAWDSFPHEHARSRAYRWGEDGLMGISDRHQYVCFSIALWNGKDPILKERLFGLTGSQGNHGEDVKECYYYLDSTPTHSYMKALYKYPQREFPYQRLLDENRRRGRRDPEFELVDTGIFDDDRYFDVFTEYAKASPDDILVRMRVFNRGPEEATVHVLPTVWFRNTWSWGLGARRQRLRAGERTPGYATIDVDSEYYGRLALQCEGSPELLFTENESNARRLWGAENDSAHVKDGIHDYVVHGVKEAVNPDGVGSKGSARYVLTVPAEGSAAIRLRLSRAAAPDAAVRRRLRRDVRGAHPRGQRLLRHARHAGPLGGRARGAAPGLRRHAVVQAVLPLRRGPLAARRPAGPRAAEGAAPRPQQPTGPISSTPTSSRCPTSGSTPGTPRGTSRSTASRSRWSTPTSPSSSSCCCCASGTCTRTASCRPTSGPSAT